MNKNVVMILSSADIRKDSRVQKEGRALVEAGYNLTICAWDRELRFPETEKIHGFTVRHFKVRSTYGRGLFQIPALLRFYSLVSRYVRESGFSIIHCHDLETLPLGVRLKKQTGAKLIFDAHEPEYFADARRFRALLTVSGRLAEKMFIRGADRVIVTNDFQRSKYASFGAKDIFLVPNYPELSRLPSRSPRANGFEDEFTVSRIGAMHYDMGIEELIDAYCKIFERRKNVKLLLAGRSTPEFQRTIKEKVNGSAGNIELITEYEYLQVPELYARTDLVVLPQKPTAWFRHITPTKFFEAMACGVPVISTAVGDIKTILTECKCGLLLSEGAPKEIVRSIGYFLENPARLNEFSSNALNCSRNKFNWGFSKQNLLTVYNQLFGA